MANEILVTPEELRAKAAEIRRLKESHNHTMNRITNLVQTLTAAWQGQAQTAFVQKYMGMQPVFDSFQKGIEEFAVLMEDHADRMEKVDQDMADRISRI